MSRNAKASVVKCVVEGRREGGTKREAGRQGTKHTCDTQSGLLKVRLFILPK